MMKKTLLLLAALSVSGCTTLHFDNGPSNVADDSSSMEQWHHNFALSLYEGSTPVDLKKICDGKKWTSAKTQLTFINGLAGSVSNFFGPIWYPKTVTVSCSKDVAEKK